MNQGQSPKPYDVARSRLPSAGLRQATPSDLGEDRRRQATYQVVGVCGRKVRRGKSLSRKYFKMRIKISRKEAKESRYWCLDFGAGFLELRDVL
jgi:hypothetical protein